MDGYKKRVHHDVLVDKSTYQDLYITLKSKYAKALIENWIEVTDPLKHVFEDLSLATFLILLWTQDGRKDTQFVDIGCGNGILTYILLMEGYKGYGMDARRRKSWDTFPQTIQQHLHETILIPQFLIDGTPEQPHADMAFGTHNGVFDDGTFLISNHADELTPYTPLLAAMTPNAGFLAIPCCEHDFSGAKVGGGFLKIKNTDTGEGRGRYGMYCDWVAEIATELGWTVEREMLRIPSTRNVGIVGRRMDDPQGRERALEVIGKLGGVNGFQGFVERARGLKDRVHKEH